MSRSAALVAAIQVLALAAAALGAAGCRDGVAPGAADPSVAIAVAKSRGARPEFFRRKVMLLGFDGCDPDLVDQYIREGKLPHFARLRREGAYGPLATLQPILSPVVWTTIATGMPPQRHGILDFITQTPAGIVPVTSKMRQADTVWELLSNQGEKVGVVGWLVTWPAEKLDGFLVTERMGQLAYQYGEQDSEGAPYRTWPDQLAAEIKRVDAVDAKEMPLARVRPFLDIEQAEYDHCYLPTFHPANRVGNMRLILSTAETYRNAGQRLYAEQKPRFFACYFEAMDALSHLFMPFAPPKSPSVNREEYLKYRNAIEANYMWHDRVLGEFMDLADADTTLFLVSDHGFKNGNYRIADGSDFADKTGAMWHRPYGVFYAWGNGVKRGATVAGASVYDVAPTVLASMGYPVPEDMTNYRAKVLTEAFEGGLAYETVPTYNGEARRDAMARLKNEEGEQKARSPEEEDAIRKLQSLGYVGGEKSDPSSTDRNLGSTFLSQGRLELAYKAFKGALDKARARHAQYTAAPQTFSEPPDSPQHPKNQVTMAVSSMAEVCLQWGRLDEAEAFIEEATKLEPQGLAPYLLRARLLVFRRKLDEAETSARAAVAIKSDMPAAWGTLAFVLQAKIAAFEKAGDRAAVQKLREALIEAYESALRLEPRQEAVLLELARTRLEYAASVEAATKAKDELDRLLETNPQNVSALNNRAIALLRLAMQARNEGRAQDTETGLAAALASAEKSISVAAARYGPDFPGYAKGWANKAYVLWQKGDAIGASEAAAKVRQIEPSYVLNANFVAAMAAAGRPVPPPAAPPAPTEPGTPPR